MPIFLPPTVTRAPNEWLRSWAVFELLVPKLGERTQHVAGDVSDGSGRVSSPLVAIDEATRSVVTRSGRVYRLVGAPGFGLEGEYVWQQWLSVADARDVEDVTADFVRRFEQAAA